MRNEFGGLPIFAGQPSDIFLLKFCVLKFSAPTSSYTLSADADAKCGLSLLLPQMANNEKREFTQLKKWTGQRGLSAWGIQTGPFAAY